MKLIRFVLIPLVLLSLQGCLTNGCYDWSDRRESLKAVTGAFNGTEGYLFRYTTDSRRYYYIASATRHLHHGGKQQPDDVTIAQV